MKTNRVHELRTTAKYLQSVNLQEKKAELRLNDRDFRAGDFLLLRGFDDGKYTGEWTYVRVTHVLPVSDVISFTEWHVASDYVVLSFNYVALGTNDSWKDLHHIASNILIPA